MKGLEKENAKVERLADRYPSFQKVLDAEPDFVAASFGATFSKGGVAPRDQFGKLGVPEYLSPSDCVGKGNSGAGDEHSYQCAEHGDRLRRSPRPRRGLRCAGAGRTARRRAPGRVKKATGGIDASRTTLLARSRSR